MSKMDILGLMVGIIGIVIALAIAWHIYAEEMEEEGGSPDDSFGEESRPRMQNEPDEDDGSRRNAALDMIDGRGTRKRGEPMPACSPLPRGTSVSFRHGRRHITGTVTGGAGRRINLLGELPGDRMFLARRKTYEVTRH